MSRLSEVQTEFISLREIVTSGAKAPIHIGDVYGTTKVVPLPKSLLEMSSRVDLRKAGKV